MEKKAIALVIPILIVGLIVIAIGAGIYIVKPFGQTIVPTYSYCQLVNGQVNYIEKSDSNPISYTCNYDECIVSGKMTLETPSSSNVFQCIAAGCVSKSFNSLAECTATPYRCSNGVACSSQNCQQVSVTKYDASFNFCPAGVASFPYCSGTTNLITSSSPNTFATGYNGGDSQYKLLGSTKQTLTFNPKYSDGSSVLKKTLIAEEWDCSCGKTFATGETCDKNSNNVMCSGGTNYKKCELIKVVGYSTCNTFGTSYYQCPTGQMCYMDKTNTTGVGLGNCRCPGSCAIGDRRGTTGTNTYEECTSTGTCATYTTQYCAEGLLWNSAKGRCDCDASKQCSINEKTCTGSNQYQECISNNINDKTCPNGVCSCTKLNPSLSNCPSNQKCVVATASDYCSCDGVSTCSLGEVKCIDSTRYMSCSKATADSCYDFSGSLTVPSDKTCDSNTNTLVGRAGCAYGTTSCGIDEECNNPQNICQCKLGTIRAKTTNTYEKCEAGTSGVNYYKEYGCASSLIFNPTSKKCECDTANSCVSKQQKCSSSTQYQTCSQKSIPDSNCINGACSCYTWDLILNSCQSPRTCKTNTAGPDSCSCGTADKCTTNQIKCLTTTIYQKCMLDPSNTQSCLDFRGSYTTPQDLNCVNNALTTKQGCRYNPSVCATGQKCKFDSANANDDGVCQIVGCAYPNNVDYDLYKCSTQKDLNEVSIEFCDNNLNKCTATQDTNLATSADQGKTRCSILNTNLVQKVVSYNVKAGTIYRWETDTSAQYSTQGVCNTDFRCGLDNGNARCISDNEFMILTAKDNYAVGELIKNISIELTSKVPNKGVGLGIVARLIDSSGNEIPGTRLTNLVVNAQGKATLNFNYGHTLVEDITLDVIVGDPNGVNYKGQKTIVVAKTLEVKLNCPTQAVVLRDISCSWKVVDKSTNELIIAQTSLSINQGTTEITNYDATYSSVTFQAPKTGSIEVSLSGSAPEYISKISKSIIIVQSPTITKDLFVDEKPYSDVILTGVGTGTHTLLLDVQESGIPAELNSIDATVLTPSGATNKLTFTEGTTGKWSAEVSMPQAGQTYVINANLVPKDIGKQVVQSEYKLATVSSGGTEDLKTLYWTIGIIVGVFVLIILILIGMVVWIRKKR